jgi:hypothetical protein
MCDDLVTFVLLYHASQLRPLLRQHDLSKSPPKSHVLVGNRNVCDRVVLIRWMHNITSIISTPIYVWWFGHVRITLSRFSAPCNIHQPDLSKSPPKSHVLVGNRNVCDRAVSARWTHNITSIISTPIYVWWFGHVRITLSRFSAPCITSVNPICQNPPQIPWYGGG